jgi:hypothetical protein
VAVDADGDIFVVGQYSAPDLDLGGGALGGGGATGVFVAKFSGNNGSHVWSRSLSATGFANGSDIEVDAEGDVIVTGFFGGTIDFGGGAVTSTDPLRDFYVVELSGADGSHLWSTTFSGAPAMGVGLGRLVRVAAGSEGVFVLGSFASTVQLGGATVTTAGESDVFLLKLAGGDGSHVWSRTFGGATTDAGVDVAVDSAGDVLLCGFFTSPTFSLGGPVYGASMLADIFLAKLSGVDGSHVWSKAIGGSGNDRATALALGSEDRVVVAGTFQSAVDFGSGSVLVNSGGSGDIFVVSYDSAGNLLMDRSIDGSFGVEEALGLAVARDGDVVLTGAFPELIDFGAGPLTTAGEKDAFVARFTEAGALVGAVQVGSPQDDQALSVAVAGDGRPVVAGFGGGTTTVGLPVAGVGFEDLLVAKLPLE